VSVFSIGAPTGTVTIYDATAAIATAPVASNPLLNIPLPRLRPGGHVLTAAYSGNANYTRVTFGNYAVQVNTGPQSRRPH
jgi:hypothetical protein